MKNINQKAPVHCSKSILINSNPEKVWNTMTNIELWPSWQHEITKTKLYGNVVPNTRFDWKSGGVTIYSTLHTVDPYKSIGWTGKSVGIFAIHNWNFTSRSDQTQVDVAESMEGFLAGLFKKTFQKNLEKGMQTWLELLKKECEKG